jgi:alpha-tubulin suppressor-like RCC1 family protein
MAYVGAGVTNTILQGQGTGNPPTYSTATYPATTTINQLLYSSASNTVNGLATGNNGVLITNTSGVPSWLADGTTGQVLTATTGSPPSWANAAGGFTWNTVSGTSQATLVANGYIAQNASSTQMTLPPTAALGSEIKFSNSGGGLQIIPAPGQTINFLNQTATFSAFFTSSSAFAAMDIISSVANTSWNVINHEGTFTTSALLGNAVFDIASLYYTKYNNNGWASGLNQFGGLGQQNRTNVSSPVSVVGGIAFKNVVGGGDTSLWLDTSGNAWGIGNNTSGQLGNLTTTSVSSPIMVLGGLSFTQLAIGNQTTTATSGYGLQANGNLWAWGRNTNGQLGQLNTTNTSSPVSVLGGFSFSYIAAGQNFAGGLVSGNPWMWGQGSSGQLGNLTVTQISSPVSTVGGFSFIKICLGQAHCLALRSDGTAWSWGLNSSGQLGNQTITGTSSPISVVGAFSFSDISVSIQSSYGLSNGSVWAWGDNAAGELGNNSVTGASSPVSVVGGITFLKLLNSSSASKKMGAWDVQGRIWAWGENLDGEIANNTAAVSYSSPVLVLNTP